MGTELLLSYALLPIRGEPNWEAALAAIEHVRLGDIWHDTLDPLYEWEQWNGETAPPNPLGAFEALRYLREQYVDDLQAVRSAFAARDPELADIEIGPFRILVTGAQSWGEIPTDLYHPIFRLSECGALAAAGFTSKRSRLSEATVGDWFGPLGRKWVTAAEATLVAADEAGSLLKGAGGLSHTQWCQQIRRALADANRVVAEAHSAWRAALPSSSQRLTQTRSGGQFSRALLRAASAGLAWSASLAASTKPTAALDDEAHELAEMLEAWWARPRSARGGPSRWQTTLVNDVDELLVAEAWYLDGGGDTEQRNRLEAIYGDVGACTRGNLLGVVLPRTMIAIGTLNSGAGLKALVERSGAASALPRVATSRPQCRSAVGFSVAWVKEGCPITWAAARAQVAHAAAAGDSERLARDLDMVEEAWTSGYHRHTHPLTVPGFDTVVMGGLGRWDAEDWAAPIRRLWQAELLQRAGFAGAWFAEGPR